MLGFLILLSKGTPWWCTMLCGHSDPPSSMAHVISSMLENYGACYRIDLSHIRRQGNKSAHLLAKYALGIDDYMTQTEENP